MAHIVFHRVAVLVVGHGVHSVRNDRANVPRERAHGGHARVLLLRLGVVRPQLLLALLELLAPCRVPVVLNRVISAARQQLCDLGPLVAQAPVPLEQDRVLFKGPPVLFDVVVQLVVPPLAALLAVAAQQVRGDQRPLRCAEAPNKLA
eukprot:CAMPEP_0179842296 /NCGR_PEP_ID=MMETSP0982-20121206/3044_1 /TAXON_ID=483367 /ORGANISM="non described non described, Strain CCMP 2436" /LENGTH=147 /DNA_ID=CAMNT_0021726545 /DNA_START=763 /DNA_END=1206 /DNA_ORIENTATION=+